VVAQPEQGQQVDRDVDVGLRPGRGGEFVAGGQRDQSISAQRVEGLPAVVSAGRLIPAVAFGEGAGGPVDGHHVGSGGDQAQFGHAIG
jgi:hypothetical protein